MRLEKYRAKTVDDEPRSTHTIIPGTFLMISLSTESKRRGDGGMRARGQGEY